MGSKGIIDILAVFVFFEPDAYDFSLIDPLLDAFHLSSRNTFPFRQLHIPIGFVLGSHEFPDGAVVLQLQGIDQLIKGRQLLGFRSFDQHLAVQDDIVDTGTLSQDISVSVQDGSP